MRGGERQGEGRAKKVNRESGDSGGWGDGRISVIRTLYFQSAFFLSLKIKFFTVSQKVREKENRETVLFYEPKMEENPRQKQQIKGIRNGSKADRSTLRIFGGTDKRHCRTEFGIKKCGQQATVPKPLIYSLFMLNLLSSSLVSLSTPFQNQWLHHHTTPPSLISVSLGGLLQLPEARWALNLHANKRE